MIWHEALAAEWLRAVRGGRSQRALSRRLGYKTNITYRWESGACFPSASDAFAAMARPLWSVDTCPVQEEENCHVYRLRGCADVTGDEAVAALYPDEEVVAASACFYLEGLSGMATTATGRVEVRADFDARMDNDVRIEGDPVEWTVELEEE